MPPPPSHWEAHEWRGITSVMAYSKVCRVTITETNSGRESWETLCCFVMVVNCISLGRRTSCQEIWFKGSAFCLNQI